MKPKKKVSALAAVLVALGSLGGGANAAIVIVAPTDTMAGSFTITQDIVFTVNSGGGPVNRIVLQQLVSNANAAGVSTALSPDLNYTLGVTSGTRSANLIDNQFTNFGTLSPEDGQLFLSSSIFTSGGDTLTLTAGSYALAPVANFNSEAAGTFTGTAFLANNAGQMRSSMVPVPEPSGALFLGLGALGFALRRSRR